MDFVECQAMVQLRRRLSAAFDPQHFRAWCFQPCDIYQNLPLDCHLVQWTNSSVKTAASKQNWTEVLDLEPVEMMEKYQHGALFSAYSGFAAGALGMTSCVRDGTLFVDCICRFSRDV